MKPWEEFGATSAPWAEFAPAAKTEPIKIGREAFADELKKTLGDTDWLTRNIAGAGSAVSLGLEGLKGIFGKTNQTNVADQKIISEEAPVGNIAGNVAMLALPGMTPAAATMRGAAAIGAAQGALLTPGDLAERAKAAGFGAAGGAAGAALARTLSSAAPIAANPNAATLAREGIGLTPGQNAGGVLKNLEDKATSIPLVGNVINNARMRGVEDFNRAAMARASLPGQPVTEIGRNGVAAVRQQLGDAYDNILSQTSVNTLEPQFVQQLASLRQMVSALPQREQRAFDTIIDRELGDRLAQNGMLNAENLQAAKSGLTQQIDNFSTATDGYQRQLGQALKQAREELQQLVARSNPSNAADLKAIDTAYANFKRIQRAAASQGAEEGVFTPAQLSSAVKAMDKSKDKRAFSEGTALLQDLTDAAKTVMPSKVPDSGTAGRLMQNLFSLGGLASTAGGALASIPVMMAYSRPGAAAINAATNRAAIPLAELIRRLGGNQAVSVPLGIATANRLGQ